MSLECGECERDLRGGHDPSCSRYVKHDPSCAFLLRESDCTCGARRAPSLDGTPGPAREAALLDEIQQTLDKFLVPGEPPITPNELQIISTRLHTARLLLAMVPAAPDSGPSDLRLREAVSVIERAKSYLESLGVSRQTATGRDRSLNDMIVALRAAPLAAPRTCTCATKVQAVEAGVPCADDVWQEYEATGHFRGCPAAPREPDFIPEDWPWCAHTTGSGLRLIHSDGRRIDLYQAQRTLNELEATIRALRAVPSVPREDVDPT